MMPFFLVTGFLGSGKTTWLKRILNDHADTLKIGIIQNEFAPGRVDSIDLQQTGKPFHVLEINKGSVFCVCLLGDFIASLQAFVHDVQPDCVILEATGLADPISIGEMLQAPRLENLYLSHIYTVVDASTFLKMQPKMTRITHQVRVADTVIINKIDLADDVRAIEQRVRELNPYARVVETSFCRVSTAAIKKVGTETVVSQHANEWRQTNAGGRPNIRSVALRIASPVHPHDLTIFLERTAKTLLRVKGYVVCSDGVTRAVQCSSGHVDVTEISNYNGITELIVMGENLEPRHLKNQLTGKYHDTAIDRDPS